VSSATRVTDPPAVGAWCSATIVDIARPTNRAAVLRLSLPDRSPHLAGQHYVIRLTADDGYTAQRSYSIASAPSDPELEFYVEALPDGEVSGYLTGVAEVGDTLEVRGPIGGWFVWTGDAPAVGIGGGSGVAPLVAMLRHAADRGVSDLLRLVVSARTVAELPYAAELQAAGATLIITRDLAPSGRAAGRLAAADLAPVVGEQETVYVCGSTGFAESAGSALMSLGVEPGRVRVEQFGPTG
jgi:ferredoxin-NADP reductase